MSAYQYTDLHKRLCSYKKKGFTLEKLLILLEATGMHLSPDEIKWVQATYPMIQVEESGPSNKRMSDEEMSKFIKDMIADTELEKRKKAVQEIELEVRENKSEVDLIKYKQQREDIEKLNSERKAVQALNLDQISDTYFSNGMSEHQKYLEAAKYRVRFMLPCFDSTVPLFGKNLLLFGAKTGEGKSSTAGQIVYSVLNQNNPATGKPCRVLVITNEESMGDVFTRVAFNFKKWPYTRPDGISDEQRREVIRFQNEMRESKRLVMVDNSFPDLRYPTTSLEGLGYFLDSVAKNKNDFDLIVIDYFQKISISVDNKGANSVDVFTRVCDMLDDFRKKLTCPIVIFAQIHPKNSDKTNFEDRIKGRKKILETATFAAEIEPDRDNYVTHFRIHKNRLVQGTVGSTITAGFDRDTGMLVTRDIPFQQKVVRWKSERQFRSPSDTASESKVKQSGRSARCR